MRRFAARLAISGEERLNRMRSNALRPHIPRLKPGNPRPETACIVGYGPSLLKTWQDIEPSLMRKVITTSGAHDFLIQKGIIPDYHVEFESRPHKAKMLNLPNQKVTYCLASVCNDNFFDKLKGHSVLLWHGMGGDGLNDADLVADIDGDDGILITGGSTAGLRSLSIGHALGFRKFELFGLDCSYADDGATWAGPHTGDKHNQLTVECNGKQFRTSDTMLNAAEELMRTIEGDLSNSAVLVNGQHLFAEWIRFLQSNPEKSSKDRWWKPVDFKLEETPIFPGIKESKELISDAYRELNRKLHEENKEYGSFGARHVAMVKMLMRLLQTSDVLDYGCGKRELEKSLGRSIHNYDPAIKGCDAAPEPADIVVCADTLEHVEMASLAAVLRDLVRVTKRVLLLEIATVQASKLLADGRNAHQIVQPAKWWVGQIGEKFDHLVPPMGLTGGNLRMICVPKG